MTTTTKRPETLDALFDVLVAMPEDDRDAYTRLHGLGDGDDLSNLPTFGGDEPADTRGIYSWDEGRLLVTDGAASEGVTISNYLRAAIDLPPRQNRSGAPDGNRNRIGGVR